MKFWRDEPRELTDVSWRLMNVPDRFRASEWDKVHEGKAKDHVATYLDNLLEARTEGIGVYIFGDNGVGKTALATIVLSRFRQYDQGALFVRFSSLMKAPFRKIMISSGLPELWEYARTVDVMLIDDFGKAHRSQGGFDSSELEDLLRDRYDKKLVTLFTSNVKPSKLRDEEGDERDDSIVKPSTVSLLQGMVSPVWLKGPSHRETETKTKFSKIWGEDDE